MASILSQPQYKISEVDFWFCCWTMCFGSWYICPAHVVPQYKQTHCWLFISKLRYIRAFFMHLLLNWNGPNKRIKQQFDLIGKIVIRPYINRDSKGIWNRSNIMFFRDWFKFNFYLKNIVMVDNKYASFSTVNIFNKWNYWIYDIALLWWSF